jgi:hypothetical protein
VYLWEWFVNIWKEPQAYFHGSELPTYGKQNLRVKKNNFLSEREKVCMGYSTKYMSLHEMTAYWNKHPMFYRVERHLHNQFYRQVQLYAFLYINKICDVIGTGWDFRFSRRRLWRPLSSGPWWWRQQALVKRRQTSNRLYGAVLVRIVFAVSYLAFANSVLDLAWHLFEIHW